MKKFITMALSVSIFFLGLGSLVDKVGAKFKSDERALAVIAQARQAIGGETAIKSVRSMTIAGNAVQTFTIDGVARTEQGNLEINLQLPNQYNKMLKIGNESDAADGTSARRETRVFIATLDHDKAVLEQENTEGRKKVFIRKDGDADKMILNENLTGDGNTKFIKQDLLVDTSRFRQNELFRTTFALLLSAPDGLDTNYTYAGVESVDGNSCDVVLAESAGSSFKLFIDQSSHLPLMVSYQGSVPVMFKFNRNEIETGDKNRKDVIINENGSQTELKDDNVKIFTRRLDAPPANAEYQIRFSDYRSVNGLNLPFKWTQTIGGQADQTVDIVSYEINPANITDKFKNERVLMRTKKPQQ